MFCLRSVQSLRCLVASDGDVHRTDLWMCEYKTSILSVGAFSDCSAGCEISLSFGQINPRALPWRAISCPKFVRQCVLNNFSSLSKDIRFLWSQVKISSSLDFNDFRPQFQLNASLLGNEFFFDVIFINSVRLCLLEAQTGHLRWMRYCTQVKHVYIQRR